mmetsp:Transcript_98480/g.205383  ORF Transcript_98480/g.205383 Transcript_98480/m.205383 type:complete len:285 (+) Transcript_98480:634-1488(+)
MRRCTRNWPRRSCGLSGLQLRCWWLFRSKPPHWRPQPRSRRRRCHRPHRPLQSQCQNLGKSSHHHHLHLQHLSPHLHPQPHPHPCPHPPRLRNRNCNQPPLCKQHQLFLMCSLLPARRSKRMCASHLSCRRLPLVEVDEYWVLQGGVEKLSRKRPKTWTLSPLLGWRWWRAGRHRTKKRKPEAQSPTPAWRLSTGTCRLTVRGPASSRVNGSSRYRRQLKRWTTLPIGSRRRKSTPIWPKRRSKHSNWKSKKCGRRGWRRWLCSARRPRGPRAPAPRPLRPRRS